MVSEHPLCGVLVIRDQERVKGERDGSPTWWVWFSVESRKVCLPEEVTVSEDMKEVQTFWVVRAACAKAPCRRVLGCLRKVRRPGCLELSR